MKKSVLISLSSDAIIREVLAIAALNGLQYDTDDQKIPLLTTDQKPALLLQAKGSLSTLLLHLLPHVASCNINDNLPDDGSDHLFQLELYLDCEATSSQIATLRHSLEHTIALDILYVCYMAHNSPLSDRYATLAQASLNDTLRLIDNTTRRFGKRVMNWL